VMGADRALETLADEAVHPIRELADAREGSHHESFPAHGTFTRIGEPASVGP
jgi:hypothetical protein